MEAIHHTSVSNDIGEVGLDACAQQIISADALRTQGIGPSAVPVITF
jgi:hypothetical protein